MWQVEFRWDASDGWQRCKAAYQHRDDAEAHVDAMREALEATNRNDAEMRIILVT